MFAWRSLNPKVTAEFLRILAERVSPAPAKDRERSPVPPVQPVSDNGARRASGAADMRKAGRDVERGVMTVKARLNTEG